MDACYPEEVANTEGLCAFPSQERMLRNSIPRRGWTLPHTCRRSLAPERAEGWAPASDHSVRHAILWASSSAAIPVDTLSLLQAGTVGGFGRLDHRREHVLLSILPGHPALNDRRALLLHSDLHIRESGARQLPLELRDGGGACDSRALRLRGGERGGHRVVAELHDVRVADPAPCDTATGV